jgi:ribosomal protein S18 acetylase RimI-like enzyme
LASAQAVKILHLEVAARNAPAQALYTKFGFIQVSRRKAYYADGGDALTMQLALP